MFILSFHARASFLQIYETLLKELNAHPSSDRVLLDQYAVESVALADQKLNVACESGIRYPSLIAMMNCSDFLCCTLIFYYILDYTSI
jgi:hypothetical protein